MMRALARFSFYTLVIVVSWMTILVLVVPFATAFRDGWERESQHVKASPADSAACSLTARSPC
jgi:hypothetical protein